MSKRMLVGLLGANIGQSLAPALHEDAAAAAGMVGHYHLMDVDGPRPRTLPELLAAVRTAGFAGVNVTFPFKEAVIPLLDEVSPEAAEIGAVNTVVFDPAGRSTGHNTDRSGFRAAFVAAFGADAVRGKAVLQLGAGGAGRAVAFALRDLGVSSLRLYDRDTQRARNLCADLGGSCEVLDAPEPAAASVAGIVNATPIGMTGPCRPADDAGGRAAAPGRRRRDLHAARDRVPEGGEGQRRPHHGRRRHVRAPGGARPSSCSPAATPDLARMSALRSAAARAVAAAQA